jgi:hypothetical protein
MQEVQPFTLRSLMNGFQHHVINAGQVFGAGKKNRTLEDN